MTEPKIFNKAFVGLTLFLTLFYTFNLGIDAAHSDGKEAVVDGVLAAFWLLSFGLFSLMNSRSEKLDRELAQSRKNLDKAMDEALSGMHKMMDEAIEEKRNHEIINAIVEDVVGKSKPNQKHIAKIVPAIYENTGLYAEVTLGKDGRFAIGLSKTPIETPAPTKKKAPAKKPVTKKATATKGGK